MQVWGSPLGLGMVMLCQIFTPPRTNSKRPETLGFSVLLFRAPRLGRWFSISIKVGGTVSLSFLSTPRDIPSCQSWRQRTAFVCFSILGPNFCKHTSPDQVWMDHIFKIFCIQTGYLKSLYRHHSKQVERLSKPLLKPTPIMSKLTLKNTYHGNHIHP